MDTKPNREAQRQAILTRKPWEKRKRRTFQHHELANALLGWFGKVKI